MRGSSKGRLEGGPGAEPDLEIELPDDVGRADRDSPEALRAAWTKSLREFVDEAGPLLGDLGEATTDGDRSSGDLMQRLDRKIERLSDLRSRYRQAEIRKRLAD